MDSLRTIYLSILQGHVSSGGFPSQVQKNVEKLVNTALTLHQKVTVTFLPTAIKFHYIFNLRDLSNIFQVHTLQSLLNGVCPLLTWCVIELNHAFLHRVCCSPLPSVSSLPWTWSVYGCTRPVESMETNSSNPKT